MSRAKGKYYVEERICAGKKRYTRKHAHNDAKDLSGNGDVMIAYKCKFCGYYHVGHAINFDRSALLGSEIP